MRYLKIVTLSCLAVMAASAPQADSSKILSVNFAATGEPGIIEDADRTFRRSTNIPLGTIISGADLLKLIGQPQTSAPSPPKISNGKLFSYVQLEAGGESTEDLMFQEIATCEKLDLFAAPIDENNMMAQCDGDIFRFDVQGNRIVFLRNDNIVVAHLDLTPGFYLINGGLVHLPTR